MKKFIIRATEELKLFEERTKFFTTIQLFRLPFSLLTIRKIVWGLAIVACGYLLIASVISRSYAVSASGGLAWGLLVFTIFVSLVNKILPRLRIASQLLPLRKESGILVFVFVLLHAFFFIWEINGWGDIPFYLFENFRFTMGSLALLLMIPLVLTSSTWAIRTMGFKSWKLLHKITHLIFILSVLHIATVKWSSEGEVEGGAIVLLFVYLGLMGFVWWRSNGKGKI